MNYAAAETEVPFLSLNRRLLIVLSVVLSVVNGGFAYLVYQKSSDQFANEQAQLRKTQAKELNALVEEGIDAMAAFATFVPRLATSVRGPDTGFNAGSIARILDEHGMMLDVEWGLRGLHYIESKNPQRTVVSWPAGRSLPAVEDLLSHARSAEVPQATVHCRPDCVQIVVMPLLRDGETVALLALERLLADSLLTFRQVSGADIAILAGSGGAELPSIERWAAVLPLLTGGNRLVDLIGQLADQSSLAALASTPQRTAFADKWFEASEISLSVAAPGLTVLAINDVTSQVAGIHEALRDSILLGLFGLAVSELVLLVLLLGPVRRIRDVVDALPLFNDKAYGVLRDALPATSRNIWLRDETVVMVEVLADVAHKMDGLESAHHAAIEALDCSRQRMQQAQSLAQVASWTGVPLAGSFSIMEGGAQISPGLAALSRWDELVALVHPDDRANLQLAWRRGRAGKRMESEFRLLVDGREIDIHVVADFTVTGRERTVRAIGMMQDISEMRQAQRALRSHRDSLESEVMTRTAELVEARNEAERLARAKGDFLATMSHEIRTPLNAVLGLSQVGLLETREHRTAETFEQILEAGDHLLNVVNDVLDHSKIEAGKISVDSRPFELRKAIEASVEMLAPRVAGKGLNMPVRFAADLPLWVEGDPFRLQQILVNLLGNGVKFTEHGSVTLDVHRAGDFVIFSIVDTGVGMSSDQVAQLFTPFYQTRNAAAPINEGTGLGLSISHSLAIMMGGEIRVRSQPGNGSEFALRLPLPEVSGDIVCADAGSVEPRPVGCRLQGLRVLVADDVRINREILQGLLVAEGATVRLVCDGQAAVDEVTRDPQSFDVVLMDVEMPGLNGREATRLLRIARIPVPVIAVTAHATAEEARKSRMAGMNDQLLKPVMQEQLVALVRRHVATIKAVPGFDAGDPCEKRSAGNAAEPVLGETQG